MVLAQLPPPQKALTVLILLSSLSLQQVAGVVAVDLDELYRQDKTAGLSATLPADMVRWEPAQETPKLAELLLINPFGITLEEMQP